MFEDKEMWALISALEREKTEISAERGEFERLKKDSGKIKLGEQLQRVYHGIKNGGR